MTNNKKIKAVIIDLDGTLRDSREMIYPALQHALKVHTGNPHTREQIAPHVHFHGEVNKVLAPDTEFEEFEGTYRGKLEELWPGIQLYKDAVAVLKQLHSDGYRIGTVTMATNVRNGLEELGISEFFDVTVGRDDVKEIKPHPAPMLAAAKKFGVEPSEVIMVGDLPVDIQAAKAAGLAGTIGITHGFGSRKDLEKAGATTIIDSLAELLDAVKAFEK